MMETAGLDTIRYDSRGLVPAIVQEARSGAVLMLAYMNAESLAKTLADGETWFYSRSRRKLWHKGETSGHFQRVKAIAVDCDSDTILLQVEQIGAACHTGNKTCFYRALAGAEGLYTGSPAVLHALHEEIVKKKKHPTEKSYTAYLLREGMDKICKKIGEEAAEVVIAAKNADYRGDDPSLRQEVCKESADLLYHLSVLWEAAGVDVNEVMRVLEERSHVEGNKKTAGHLDKTF